MQKTLTQNDRKKIQQKIWGTVGIILFAIAMFTAIYFFVLRNFLKNGDDFGWIPTVILSLFAIFFLGIAAYLIQNFSQDLKIGVKNCIEGVVEDKRLNIKKTSRHRTGRGRSSKSSTQRYYYITVNGEAHKIPYDMYTKAKVGDTIYFEVTPNSKIILSYTILKSEVATALQTAPKIRKGAYPTSRQKQSRLTREDKATIRDLYDKGLRRRFMYISIVGLPIFGLVYNGLWVFALFIFPLPIILLYQVYKAILLYIHTKKSIREGKKNVTTTQVIDKLFTTITKNGRSSSNYKLKTTYKTIIVPEHVYGNVHTGNEIVVHEAMYTTAAIGLTVDDHYYSFYTDF
ncbi:MAG: hypothetical protein AAF617_09560 [Bacteroidota bacterium]